MVETCARRRSPCHLISQLIDTDTETVSSPAATGGGGAASARMFPNGILSNGSGMEPLPSLISTIGPRLTPAARASVSALAVASFTAASRASAIRDRKRGVEGKSVDLGGRR